MGLGGGRRAHLDGGPRRRRSFASLRRLLDGGDDGAHCGGLGGRLGGRGDGGCGSLGLAVRLGLGGLGGFELNAHGLDLGRACRQPLRHGLGERMQVDEVDRRLLHELRRVLARIEQDLITLVGLLADVLEGDEVGVAGDEANELLAPDGRSGLVEHLEHAVQRLLEVLGRTAREEPFDERHALVEPLFGEVQLAEPRIVEQEDDARLTQGVRHLALGLLALHAGVLEDHEARCVLGVAFGDHVDRLHREVAIDHAREVAQGLGDHPQRHLETLLVHAAEALGGLVSDDGVPVGALAFLDGDRHGLPILAVPEGVVGHQVVEPVVDAVQEAALVQALDVCGELLGRLDRVVVAEDELHGDAGHLAPDRPRQLLEDEAEPVAAQERSHEVACPRDAGAVDLHSEGAPPDAVAAGLGDRQEDVGRGLGTGRDHAGLGGVRALGLGHGSGLFGGRHGECLVDGRT